MKIRFYRRWLIRKDTSLTAVKTGQSLVEFAIILPILLLMLLGVFEVGWTLRGYLTLANANREAARFASRGVYLNFNEKEDPNKVGFSKIVTHTLDSLSNQLSAMDFVGQNPSDNASMIVTYYSVNPGAFLCPGDAECTNFDCSKFLDPGYDGTADQSDYDIDDLNDIQYPLLIPPAGYEGYDVPPFYNTRIPNDTQAGLIDHFEAITSYHYHSGGAYFSRINPANQVAEFRAQSNVLNCELRKKGLPESDLKVIVVENIFLQPQLVGLPFVTAFVPNPIPLYTHTTMRINPAARQAAEDTRQVCSLYPIMIPSSVVSGKQFGEDLLVPVDNNSSDVPGNFGFITWDPSKSGVAGPGTASEQELEDNLLNPSNAATKYQDPIANPADNQINIGNWVAGSPGVSAGVKDELDGLIGEEMLFPVWNDSDCLLSGEGSCANAQQSGSNSRYKVFTFVRMVLTDVTLTGQCDLPDGSKSKCLAFRFVQFEPNACEEVQQ